MCRLSFLVPQILPQVPRGKSKSCQLAATDQNPDPPPTAGGPSKRWKNKRVNRVSDCQTCVLFIFFFFHSLTSFLPPQSLMGFGEKNRNNIIHQAVVFARLVTTFSTHSCTWSHNDASGKKTPRAVGFWSGIDCLKLNFNYWLGEK